MLISVRHTTRYNYTLAARYSVQSLRLTPSTFDGQRILSWDIKTRGIESAVQFRDGFGNIGHLVSFMGEHQDVEIEAGGLLEVIDKDGIVRGTSEPAPARVYLRATSRTEINDDIRKLATVKDGRDEIGGLHALMDAIADQVEYVVGATNAHTSAASALADGRGVCQDHAHIFIAAARFLGIPARYVTGYFLKLSDNPSEAHHAWAEAFVPGLGWVGFDPANRTCPTDRYIRLACGLDSGSAAPIRGTRRGGAFEVLDVVVEVAEQNGGQNVQQ